MATNYSSTAQALASPPSPDNRQPHPPSFRRMTSQSSRRRNGPSGFDQNASFQQRALQIAEATHKKMIATYKAMSLIQRIGAAAGLTTVLTLTIVGLVFSHAIFAWLGPIAERWRDVPFGWMVLWIVTFCTAFPPMIGYSTCITVAGFVYGVFPGFAISATAAVVGSTVSFIVSRTILSAYVHRLVGDDTRFRALALTLKHDGLKILCMIRLCPLPYSLSNGALSTIPTITPLNFAIATTAAMPKLLIHSFIGARLGALARSGDEMDTGTKIINYLSIAGGIILGGVLGLVIYRRTMARARELEQEEEILENDGMLNPDEFEGTNMDEDDISLWDNEEGGYRDDVSETGNDEEANIGLENGKKALL